MNPSPPDAIGRAHVGARASATTGRGAIWLTLLRARRVAAPRPAPSADMAASPSGSLSELVLDLLVHWVLETGELPGPGAALRRAGAGEPAC